MTDAPSQPQRHFRGFEPLTANYIYCPNQFLDICVPNCSRGEVRIVAYLIRQTLGWLDENGQPINEEVQVSYRDLIEKAGVSRGSIGPAIQKLVQSRFIRVCSTGQSKATGRSGQSAKYALRWSASSTFTKSVDEFDGFFVGEGHRTPIPNSFFDEIIPTETRAVVKVVGTVLRHTIGYQNQFGGRRKSAPLSYNYVQRYAGLNSRSGVSEAIAVAQERGYITCTQAGQFDADRSQQSAACYSVRWFAANQVVPISSKNEPEDRFNKRTSNGSKSRPVDRFKKRTTSKTDSKDIHKQQHVASQETEAAIQLLLEAGVDRAIAFRLVEKSGPERVQRQLQWLDARTPRENRIGLLCKSITEDWSPPPSIAVKNRQKSIREREQIEAAKQSQESKRVAREKAARAKRRERLLSEWDTATSEQRKAWIQTAVKAESSCVIADIIRRQGTKAESPHCHVLDAIAAARKLPPISVASDSPRSSIGYKVA
ncbi:hypothetical protein KOR42_32010 [Thalassoglobus neptunius]|uniref:Uncharacterized protein n=1 Tax=Thalassoglobus neptunius TaxID=1938619 RepID=A0A5C5WP55_9PLAN|nr:hypothetical protein [Thalassoglobus neptunius]TWT51919.1 hypothetical protein KOR42_32010 [Thalassoglobus neptunius]